MREPIVVSVNVGRAREIERNGEVTTTAIWKAPVDGRVAVRGVNVEGDEQADRTVHGGPDKAVYAYASEDTEWWEGELGRRLGPGAFGENLTVAGLDVTGALIGERWQVDTTLLEVSQPRIPCWKLGRRMDDPRFLKRFADAGRPGAYLRIVEEGEVAAADAIEVVHRPDHEITVGLVSHAYLHDHALAPRLLDAPALSKSWVDWAEAEIERLKVRASSSR
jgi:MOSC domain-containing protein YiiM